MASGIGLGMGFDLPAPLPIDSRLNFKTIADMASYPDSDLPETYFCTNDETGLFYTYAKTNSVDATLGKWRALSTAGLQTELDKKANDDEVLKTTDISTTIDGTSTNDTVPTNKVVYDSLLNKVNNTIVLTNADEVNSFDRAYQSFIIEPPVAEAVGLPKAPDSTWFCINLSHAKGFKYPSQIAFEYAGIERIMYRTANNGVWNNWRKIPNTSVSDTSGTVTLPDGLTGNIVYKVINEICYVTVQRLADGLTGDQVPTFTGLPRASMYVNVGIESSGYRVGSIYSDDGVIFNVHKISDVGGYCSFSYPVEKS